MDKSELIRTVSERIQQGELSRAFELLHLHVKAKDLEKKVVLLEARLKRLQESDMHGIIKTDDRLIELNKITKSLQDLLDILGKEPASQKVGLPGIPTHVLFMLVGLLLLFLLLWELAFRMRSPIGIEGKMWVSSIVFQAQNGQTLDVRSHHSTNISIQNPGQLLIQADSISIAPKEESILLDEHRMLSLTSFGLRPTIHLEEIGVDNKIPIRPNSILSLSKEEHGEFQLGIQHSDTSLPQLSLYYAKQLQVRSKRMLLGANSPDTQLRINRPFHLTCYNDQASNRELFAQGIRGNALLLSGSVKDFHIRGLNIHLSDSSLELSSGTSGEALPTILKGEIRIQEATASEPWRTISMKETTSPPKGVKFRGLDMDIRELAITEQGVLIDFVGKTELLELTHGQTYHPYNPDNLEWIWQNFPVELIICSILIGSLLIFAIRKLTAPSSTLADLQ
ncbi:MAG: hypothetical protein AAF587_07030 [Bacteroidota bacterium]